MPTDKEIEWALYVPDPLNRRAEILRDAYLAMKAERDRYKAMVEVDGKALSAVAVHCHPDNESQDQMYRRLEQVFDSVLRDLD